MATNAAPSAAELQFQKQRYALHCWIKSGPDGKPMPMKLFTDPDPETRVLEDLPEGPVDIWVDSIVDMPPFQFIGGAAFAPTDCRALERQVPDGSGGQMAINHWYMLSTDLECELKQPGQE